MSFLEMLKRVPLVDLGTGHKRHFTKSKKISYRQAKMFAATGKRALDMGCGDGFWSKKLSDIGYQVTSIDLEKKIDEAVAVDLEKGLPFEDNSFDLVWSTDVIEHLHQPEMIIREIKRILRPEGQLIMTTPNSFFWLYPIFKLFGYTPKELQNPDHKQFFSLKDVRVLFPRAAIYGFFPYTLIKLTIKNPYALHHLSPSFIIVVKKENI